MQQMRFSAGVGRYRWGLGTLIAFGFLCCSLLLLLPSSTVAAIPTKMNFQGRLTDSAGNTVADGSYNMKFLLYTASSGGSSVWNETRETTSRVTVTNGLFSVKLGDVTPIPDSLFSSGNLYLEIVLAAPPYSNATCSTAACATYESAMTPRNQLATSAYSFNSEQLDGLDSTAFAQLDAANQFLGYNQFYGSTLLQGTNTLEGETTISHTHAEALKVQNALGVKALTVDTVDGKVMVGDGTASEKLDIIGNWKVRDASTPTKAVRVRTSGLDLDFETGGDKIQFSTWSGADFTGTQYNQFRLNADGTPINVQRAMDLVNAIASDVALKITGAASQTADLLQVKANASAVVMAVNPTGATTLKNSSNSTAAFAVQDAAAASLLTVDTTNKQTVLTNSGNGTVLKLVGAAADATNVAVMGVYNSAGTRVGYLGDGYTTSTSMYLQADTGNSINMGINGGTSFNLDSSGDVQIGVQNGSMSGHALVVSNTSASPMAVRRNTNDGNLISFYRDSTLQGSISVSGATVAYNAFTGSHYAWIDGEVPDRGMLVTMTGNNQYVGEKDSSEIVYGVAPTAVQNDPAVLGSYLSLSEPAKPFDRATNPHQIMSVGNGEMWVAETGRGDIKPGDDLISSAVPGHAMKDPSTSTISNIVARASEKVDWSQVTTTINGVKHVRISVLFGSYAKNNIQKQQTSFNQMYVGDIATINKLVLKGHLVGNKDTRGRVMIPAGQTSVTYHFSGAYDAKPFVVASPESGWAPYFVDATAGSFTIRLNSPADTDQWFVFMVQG